MTEETAIVKNGLDSRSAALLVQAASKFSSSITLGVGTKKINAKSIMGVISIGLSPGTSVSIMATGGDEAAAALEIAKFFA